MPSQIDYNFLLQQIRQNDFAAFDVIYHEFASRLVAYAKKYVKSEELAKDISQEALLKLANNPPDKVLNNNIAPWLYRVTRNLAIDKQRRAKFEVVCDDTQIPEPPSESNPLQDLVNANDASVVREILSRLPDELRETVELRIDKNMSFKDMADKLNIPIGTALWRMHRALQLLREYWNAYGKN